MRLLSHPNDLLLLSLLGSTTVVIANPAPARAPSQSELVSSPQHWPRTPIHPDLPDLPAALLRSFTGAHVFDLSTDWIVDFHTFHTLLPVHTAASTLLSFYEEIAAKAATTALLAAERSYLRIGEVTLEVRSTLGVLPWGEVVGFANWMRENTKRGFTGTYVINFVHRPTGKLVTMSLLIGILRWG